MTISKKPQLHTLNLNRSTMRFPIHLFVLLAAACWTLPSQAQTLADILADDCDAFVGGTYINHNAFGADPNVPPTIEATAADSSWSLQGTLTGFSDFVSSTGEFTSVAEFDSDLSDGINTMSEGLSALLAFKAAGGDTEKEVFII